MRYLLDTNIISELIAKNPNERVIDFLLSIKEQDTCLSVITIGEIRSGVEGVRDEVKRERLFLWLKQDLLERFQERIIPVDLEVMWAWGEITQHLKSFGRPLPLMDSLLGATCVSKNLRLVTRNTKDFRNLKIELLNPFDV